MTIKPNFSWSDVPECLECPKLEAHIAALEAALAEAKADYQGVLNADRQHETYLDGVIDQLRKDLAERTREANDLRTNRDDIWADRLVLQRQLEQLTDELDTAWQAYAVIKEERTEDRAAIRALKKASRDGLFMLRARNSHGVVLIWLNEQLDEIEIRLDAVDRVHAAAIARASQGSGQETK